MSFNNNTINRFQTFKSFSVNENLSVCTKSIVTGNNNIIRIKCFFEKNLTMKKLSDIVFFRYQYNNYLCFFREWVDRLLIFIYVHLSYVPSVLR